MPRGPAYGVGRREDDLVIGVAFFRKEVVEFALGEQTRKAVDEQRAAIAAEPANPRPYHNLALLYRLQDKPDEALGLLLEAVRLDPQFAEAHMALAEIYAVRGDMAAARRHAATAAARGAPQARQMLDRWEA